MRTVRQGRGTPERALVFILAVSAVLGAGDALGYGEEGYYTGAYALVGEGGCAGGAMGINPTGGCTPGVDALIRSEAFATGVQGFANHGAAIADLSLSSLKAVSIFPDGSGNSPAAVANLTDTFTAVGDLSGDVTVTVAMYIGSVVTGGEAGSGYGTLAARLSLTGSLDSGSGYYFRDPTCNGAGGHPCTTVSGWAGYDLLRTVTVNDANRSFRVDAFLDASGGGNPGRHSTDGWAQIHIWRPEGIHFVSASGVFQTLPEPSQTALSLMGVATIGAASRRARRARSRHSPGARHREF